MPENKRTATDPIKDTSNADPVDNRGGTFDPGTDESTKDIYTNPDDLPEGLRRKKEGPLGTYAGAAGGNK